MFNLSHVSSVTSSGDEELPDHFKPKAELPKINTDKLKERAAIEKEKRRAAMGDNVSIEAQDVFDAISRTYVLCFVCLSRLTRGEVPLSLSLCCLFHIAWHHDAAHFSWNVTHTHTNTA